MPKNFAVQLSGEYQSRTNLSINNNQSGSPFGQQAQSSAQGYIRAFWGMDLAVRKSSLKNNAATIGITFSDLFRTRKQDQNSESIYFAQDYYRLNNPQMVRLNFSYRFRKIDINVFKRQNMTSSVAQDAKYETIKVDYQSELLFRIAYNNIN